MKKSYLNMHLLSFTDLFIGWNGKSRILSMVMDGQIRKSMHSNQIMPLLINNLIGTCQFLNSDVFCLDSCSLEIKAGIGIGLEESRRGFFIQK